MRTMNASLLLDAGVDLAICVNPLVAFDASRAPASRDGAPDLTRGGLPVVLSQMFRALIQSRMQVGMATYERRYPRTDMLLIEPDRGDEELFFKNVFSYADRRRLAEHAYRCTRRDLRASAPAVGRMLARHGLRLRHEVLDDESRSSKLRSTNDGSACSRSPARCTARSTGSVDGHADSPRLRGVPCR
jgi:hypothetical protein